MTFPALPLPPASTVASAERLGSAAAALAAASLAPNTIATYQAALDRLAKAGFTADSMSDAALANALASMAEAGASPSSCSVAAAAAAKAADLMDRPSPRGRLTAKVLAGIARTHRGRGRGQSAPLTVESAAAILATAKRRRQNGRGRESAATAAKRGALDIAIVGLLFHAGLRRSEAAALTWADVAAAPNVPGSLLVTVRISKTNQDGSRADVRAVKGGYADAIRSLRPGGLTDAEAAKTKVLGLAPATISRRLTAAARAAGVEGRITGHSGRIGLASELVARGASTVDVMLAGGWTTSRMVAHYSAGARAERGATIRFL